MDIKINITELMSILDMTPASQNIMLMGAHGIGKSEILKSYFEGKGMRFVPVFCSQAADPGDIIGLPYRDNDRTDYALPNWFPIDNQPVVIFLDELNRARPEILQVVQDLTLNRKLVGHELPAGSRIMSAINVGDEYQIVDLDPALVSRFNVYMFEPTVDEWIAWAMNSKLDSSVVEFIRMYPASLDEKLPEDADPMMKCGDRRAWKRVADIMAQKPVINDTFSKMICGIVGASSGVKFYDYVRNRKRLSPADVLMDFDKVKNDIEAMSLAECTAMNDSICAWIGVGVGMSPKSGMVLPELASNLLNYLGAIIGHNREAVSHLIGNYESGRFPAFNIFVDSNQDLQAFFYAYIDKISKR